MLCVGADSMEALVAVRAVREINRPVKPIFVSLWIEIDNHARRVATQPMENLTQSQLLAVLRNLPQGTVVISSP